MPDNYYPALVPLVLFDRGTKAIWQRFRAKAILAQNAEVYKDNKIPQLEVYFTNHNSNPERNSTERYGYEAHLLKAVF